MIVIITINTSMHTIAPTAMKIIELPLAASVTTTIHNYKMICTLPNVDVGTPASGIG